MKLKPTSTVHSTSTLMKSSYTNIKLKLFEVSFSKISRKTVKYSDSELLESKLRGKFCRFLCLLCHTLVVDLVKLVNASDLNFK